MTYGDFHHPFVFLDIKQFKVAFIIEIKNVFIGIFSYNKVICIRYLSYYSMLFFINPVVTLG